MMMMMEKKKRRKWMLKYQKISNYRKKIYMILMMRKIKGKIRKKIMIEINNKMTNIIKMKKIIMKKKKTLKKRVKKKKIDLYLKN